MRSFLHICIVGVLLVLLLTACGQNEAPDTQSVVPTSTETASVADTNVSPSESTENEDASSEKDSAPELVADTYYAFRDVIDGNGLDLVLGSTTKQEAGDLVLYDFPLSNSTVSIRYYNGSFSSMLVQLSEKDSNSDLKSIITTAISACGGVGFAEATQLMQSMVNSYDGEDMSDLVNAGKYRFVLVPPASSLMTDTLNIIPANNMDGFDKAPYSEANAEYMGAKMNKGELVYITGTVKQDEYLGTSNALEIENSEGKFIVYYDLSKFAGEFEIGKSYTFYGTIAGEYTLSGYDGYLRLDYFEKAG